MKSLAFDLGKVLFDFDYNIALNKIREKNKILPEKILNALFYEDFALDFEKGLISDYDFYLKFIKTFKILLNYNEFVDIWCKIFFPKYEIINLIKKLKIIYKLYLISNINQLHFEYLYKKYKKTFLLFDDLILSYKVNSVKPEEKIYQKLKEVSNQDFQNIIYIDDRKELIESAKKLGLNCIHFTDKKTLIKNLEDFQIFIPTYTETNILIDLNEKIKQYKCPILVGMGNNLKSDDGIAIELIEEIKGKIKLKTINVGVSLENYLDKLRNIKSDLYIFIDAGNFDSKANFFIFYPKDIESINLYSTHNTSIRLSLEYLQKQKESDIFILLIKGRNFKIGESLSTNTKRSKIILKNFFLKNFSN